MKNSSPKDNSETSDSEANKGKKQDFETRRQSLKNIKFEIDPDMVGVTEKEQMIEKTEDLVTDLAGLKIRGYF